MKKRIRKPVKTVITKKCVVCGKLFEMNRNKKTCGPECADIRRKYVNRINDRKRREKARIAQESVKITCSVCGKKFVSKKGKKYCSDDCRRKAEKKRNRERYQKLKGKLSEGKIVKCGCCGKEFNTKNGGSKYCSKDCRLIMSRRISAEYNRNKRELTKAFMMRTETKSSDGIDAVAAAAKAAGMSYGQYKAAEFLKRQESIL